MEWINGIMAERVKHILGSGRVPMLFMRTTGWASGALIICASHEYGGLAEIIENGRSGLLVPLVRVNSGEGYDIDIQKLAQAQLAILSDSLLANRLGNGAKARVYSIFNSRRVIDGTLHSYRSLISPAISAA